MNFKLLADIDDKDYRDALVEGYVRDGIAFQIRAMRMARNLDQKQLAKLMGNEKLQSLVSRYENPDYGRFSVSTLLELARTFDVGLIVRFADWEDIVSRDEEFSGEPLNIASYAQYKKRRKLPVPPPLPQKETRGLLGHPPPQLQNNAQWDGQGGNDAAFSSAFS